MSRFLHSDVDREFYALGVYDGVGRFELLDSRSDIGNNAFDGGEVKRTKALPSAWV